MRGEEGAEEDAGCSGIEEEETAAGGGGERERERMRRKGEEGIRMASRDKRRELLDGLHPTTLNEIRVNKLFISD